MTAHDDRPVDAGRRRFLRLSLGLPLASASLIGPLVAQAAPFPRYVRQIPLPRRKPPAPRLLVIDAGHGGRDPGAIGGSGTYEKTVTLDITRRMAEILSGKPDIAVRLTRDKDAFLPLEERVRIARATHADLFVSVHADSAPNKAARGLSVYTLAKHASDDFAQHVADRENRTDALGGVRRPKTDAQVASILADLTSRETRNTSRFVQAEFVHDIDRSWRLLEHPMRAADFVVLTAPDVPSILVETGFLSNPEDENILRQPSERERIARLMAEDLRAIMAQSWFV
jgi:N-acetylmuramoyl-L-alanine amidase